MGSGFGRVGPAGAPAGEEAAEPEFGGDQVGEAVEGDGVAVGRRAQRLADDAGLDQARVREERRVEEGEELRERGAQPRARGGGRDGRVGSAPARREVVDAGAGEDRAQDAGPGVRLDPERFGEVAAGPYDLVVEEGGVQPLAPDLRGLLQDPVVGRRAGGGRRARVPRRGAGRRSEASPPGSGEPILQPAPPPSASVPPDPAATRRGRRARPPGGRSRPGPCGSPPGPAGPPPPDPSGTGYGPASAPPGRRSAAPGTPPPTGPRPWRAPSPDAPGSGACDPSGGPRGAPGARPGPASRPCP